jgi:A/G-specific adenine glycosylase
LRYAPVVSLASEIRHPLLAWYAASHRDLPWRGTSDPWAVLVSEVMLQQTQASRVATRFGPFLDRFPTPAAIAEAPEPEVLVAWAGLGYNRRALALRRAAVHITRDGWPDPAALERLAGVGRYTARAVASLAFGLRVGPVDTNVRRWLVRRLGLPPTTSAARLQDLADEMAGHAIGDAAAWTQATMELGATVCTARNPRCDACPIADGCPSRSTAARVPVPRQPAFEGSDRERRGALVRRLGAAADRSLSRRTVGRELGLHAERILAGLERDGLLHRSGGRVWLGGAAGTAGTAGVARTATLDP